MDPIYTHTKHTLPGGAKDMLNKLRAFLLARGWTVEHYNTSVTWASDGDGTYSFHAGNDDFLQVKSSGYGSQVLRFRFLVDYDASHLSHYYIRPTCIDPTNNGVIDESVSTHPVDQNKFTYTTYTTSMSIPASTFNELNFYGNDKFCLITIVATSTICLCLCFGTFDLFPEYQSTTELGMLMPFCSSSSGPFYWDDNPLTDSRFYGPHSLRAVSNYPHFTWFRGASRNYSTVRFNWQLSSHSIMEYWNDMNETRVINAWTGKRLMFRPLLFGLNATSTWECMGYHPVYAVYSTGLSFGETLTYGAETFDCYRTPTIAGGTDGYAVRTA